MAKLTGETKRLALVEAKKLLQRYGFNGFSFQHVADVLGIKKPSLYDHFESKDELGLRLIQDYQRSFTIWANTVQGFSPDEKLGQYYELFHRFSAKFSGLCPMSALIGDYFSLSKVTKKALLEMYDDQSAWVVEVVKEGQKKKFFRRDLSAKELSSAIISLGIGSQFSARILQSPEHIQKMKSFALAFLKA